MLIQIVTELGLLTIHVLLRFTVVPITINYQMFLPVLERNKLCAAKMNIFPEVTFEFFMYGCLKTTGEGMKLRYFSTNLQVFFCDIR